MICNFSSVAFSFFGLPVHWYSLAYIAGIFIALKLSNLLAIESQNTALCDKFEEFVSYAILGIIFGGRLGHVLFYDFEFYHAHPMEIIKIWRGGMSFYGGFIGVLLATHLFCQKRKIVFLKFTDIWAVGAPIGLFLGRVANFINGELLGKESNVAWCVVFSDEISRHPSQIYEAFLEGILLFSLMLFAFKKKCHLHAGLLSGIFCIGYGSARFTAEFFREPDSVFSHKLFCSTGLNLNQYMSMIMVVFGIIIIFRNKIRDFFISTNF
jgi:phosphatidylglycerol:prolipoprotein diacylglycerol transferase